MEAQPSRSRAPPRKRKNSLSGDTWVLSSSTEGKVAQFVSKLWSILQNCDTHVAHWAEDGISFCINEELAPSTIIPEHFAHSSWRSLLRQLSCYGFRKTRRKKLDPSSGGWSEFAHDCFVRNAPELMCKIKRMEHLLPSSPHEDAAHNKHDELTPRNDVAPAQPVTDVPKRARTVSGDSDDDILTSSMHDNAVNLNGLAALGMAAKQVLQVESLDVGCDNALDIEGMVAELHHLRARVTDLERILVKLTPCATN